MMDGETELKSLDQILSDGIDERYEAAETAPDAAPAAGDTGAPAQTSDNRDPATGRFAARGDAPAADAAAQNTDQGSKPADGAASAVTPSDAPASLSAAEKAIWKTLPPDAQAMFARREADFSKGLEQKTQGYQALETVIAPRRDRLAAEFGSVENAVKTLFDLSDFAGRDKPGFARWYFQAHSLDPQAVFGGAVQPQGGQAPQPGQGDGAEQTAHVAPELAAVQAELHTLKSEMIEMIQAPIIAKAQTELEQFEADTANVHYEAVKQDMARILANSPDPNMTYRDAYDAACWGRPDIRKQLIESERKAAIEAKTKEAAEAAKNARRAAGPQLRSVGTPSEVRAAPISIDQTLSDAYDRITGAA